MPFLKKITPSAVCFITTYKCTASCTNCCFQCSPRQKSQLSIDEIKSYLHNAVHLYPSIKILILTGGECFLLGSGLIEIVKFAKFQNLLTRVVTNAYWAYSEEKAEKILQPLVEAGLTEINFSTGDDHLKDIPLIRVKNAILASVKLGLKPLVNIESNPTHSFSVNSLLEDTQLKSLVLEGNLSLVNGIWVQFRNAKPATQEKNRPIFQYKHGSCKNLFHTITIDANHRMVACCGLTAKANRYLDLGSVQHFNIKELYERQFLDFIKIWLYTEGPIGIVKFLSEKGLCDINDYRNLHDCLICFRIFQNNQFLKYLRLSYEEVFTNIYLNFCLNC